MKYNHPINPYQFQERINQYAQDIVIVWNAAMKRFQVCQALRPVVNFNLSATQAEMRKHKLRPMFTIQHQNGDYREPDESDLQRVIDSIKLTQKLQIKGFNHFADTMEAEEIAREESVAPGVKDAMEWGASELFKIRTQKGILGFR